MLEIKHLIRDSIDGGEVESVCKIQLASNRDSSGFSENNHSGDGVHCSYVYQIVIRIALNWKSRGTQTEQL